MYSVRLRREFILLVDTFIEATTVAFCAYKKGWEVDIINSVTGEVMISLPDDIDSYFSNAIHEIM